MPSGAKRKRDYAVEGLIILNDALLLKLSPRFCGLAPRRGPLAKTALVLERGELVFAGTPDELRRQPEILHGAYLASGRRSALHSPSA